MQCPFPPKEQAALDTLAHAHAHPRWDCAGRSMRGEGMVYLLLKE